jgi:hypothetical protein
MLFGISEGYIFEAYEIGVLWYGLDMTLNHL